MMKTKINRFSKRVRVPVVLILISMLCLISCEAKNRSATSIEPNFTNTMVSDLDRTDRTGDPTDEDITASIEFELIIQDGVNSNDIDVKTKEGIVTLSGKIDHILAKDRAIEIAKAIKGVRSVIDKMQIEKSEFSDAVLKKSITNALLNDPATDSYEVQAEVNDGHAILTGKVDSWQEKKLAAKVAKGVIGVRSLENNIVFEFKENRSDLEIKNDVVQTMRWDVRVDDAMVDVAVKDGIVTLSGIVGSATEHSQAEIDAWVAGVRQVKTNDLKVKRWARDEDLRADKYVSKSDEDIRLAVKQSFVYDPRVFSFNPEVSVNNGKVTLTGVVDNLKAKRVAEMDARNVVGVWRVVNLLKVRGIDVPTDMTIEENSRAALRRNPYVESFQVGVTSVDGTVYLNGSVNTYFDKYEAGDAVSTVNGVVDVVNNLKVSDSSVPYVFDYEYGLYYPYGHVYNYGYSPVKTDWEIKSDIEDQIYWSPNVDLNDVEVSVNNGAANLEGTVESWTEYYYAEKNAFEGGALSVDNDLDIALFMDETE